MAYNITVSGYGQTRTYAAAEREVHEEMYVASIDKFLGELRAAGIKTHSNYMDVLLELKCSHASVGQCGWYEQELQECNG